MIKRYALTSLLILYLILPSVSWANGPVALERGVQYEILFPGNGLKATPGKIATIHFIMWQDHNGEKGEKLFDSRKEGRPLSFKICTKSIAEGLNIGVNGMNVGEIRRLHVPSHLNPKKGSGKFPGNADLIFEVELLDVR